MKDKSIYHLFLDVSLSALLDSRCSLGLKHGCISVSLKVKSSLSFTIRPKCFLLTQIGLKKEWGKIGNWDYLGQIKLE